jgi:nucleoside-diphosphate-sugar epimerase
MAREDNFESEPITNKHVFVAGGAGFVGSALIRQLLLTGTKVTSYDNYFHGRRGNIQGLQGNLTILDGDARDLHALQATLSGWQPDYIINCIGDTFVPAAYSEPQRFFDINLKCTLNILQAAKHSHVKRILHVSSTEVYGSTGLYSISEKTPIDPINTYAVSKAAADRLCATFFLEHGVPVVIARIFNCYGPRATHPYVIPEIIAQLSRGDLVCLGNLEAKRDFTYVDDTAVALIALLTSSAKDGDSVNVGSGVSFSVRWLVQQIAREMAIDNPKIYSDVARLRKHDIDCFRCDNTKLRHITGWAPKVDIFEGLRRTVQWYRQGERRWSWEEYTNDICMSNSVPACGEILMPIDATEP